MFSLPHPYTFGHTLACGTCSKPQWLITTYHHLSRADLNVREPEHTIVWMLLTFNKEHPVQELKDSRTITWLLPGRNTASFCRQFYVSMLVEKAENKKIEMRLFVNLLVVVLCNNIQIIQLFCRCMLFTALSDGMKRNVSWKDERKAELINGIFCKTVNTHLKVYTFY